jgi:PAS domain S-box-containing protein
LLGNLKSALDEAAIVAVTDPQGTILSVNRKFCELSGYSSDELIGANHRILCSGVHDAEVVGFIRTADHVL